MTDRGLDYSLGRPNLDEAWAAGYRFVMRYLSWRPNPKCITAPELADLLARGFEVGLNWEFDAQDALGGAAAGHAHGVEAVAQAKALGYPSGCTIYFSADFDETPGQAPTVEAYMRSAGSVVHADGYRMGAYGGYWTIKRLLDAAAIDDGWQAYAWSGGQWDPRANLRQVQNGVTVGGADCDLDERVGITYLMGDPAPGPTVEAKMYTIVPGPDNTKWLCDGMYVRQVTDSEISDLRYIASLGAIQLWKDPVTGSDIWNGGLVPAFGVDVATLVGGAGGGPLILKTTGTVTLTGTATPAP